MDDFLDSKPVELSDFHKRSLSLVDHVMAGALRRITVDGPMVEDAVFGQYFDIAFYGRGVDRVYLVFNDSEPIERRMAHAIINLIQKHSDEILAEILKDDQD